MVDKEKVGMAGREMEDGETEASESEMVDKEKGVEEMMEGLETHMEVRSALSVDYLSRLS